MPHFVTHALVSDATAYFLQKNNERTIEIMKSVLSETLQLAQNLTERGKSVNFFIYLMYF